MYVFTYHNIKSHNTSVSQLNGQRPTNGCQISSKSLSKDYRPNEMNDMYGIRLETHDYMTTSIDCYKYYSLNTLFLSE